MVSAKSVYLIAYNLASAAGWATVLYLAVQHRLGDKPAKSLWSSIDMLLTVTQTAAFMEIVHSLVGLVSSPVVTVTLQVSSRLLLVWAYTRVFAQCQADWSLYLMVISWSCVEVPRYLFYVFKELPGGKVPYPLFWLRYSLFMVLYPTGISGELLQMWASTEVTKKVLPTPTYYYFTLAVFAVYALGSPYMILSMWKNRVREFKKLKEGAKKKN
jgi:very-long-chain (3R)-3-hydroxyacyl-CoA dehydratase